MSSHHEHAPSSLDPKAVCPGYTPDNSGDNTAADRGGLLHKARETADLSICPTEWDAELVSKCLAYIAAVKAKMPGCLQIDEHRLEIAGGITFGTGDCFLIAADNKTAHYFDTKFAWKKQAPLPDNMQMQAYVSGIMDDYKSLEAVKVHMLYPQLDVVETHVYRRSDKDAIDVRIKTIIGRCEYWKRTGDVKVLRATERCKYCARCTKGVCEAVAGWLLPMVARYEALPYISEVHASKIKDPGAEAAKYYEVLDVADKMISGAKRHLKELALENGGFKNSRGEVIFTVRTENGRKQVADTVKFAEHLAGKYGITASELLAFSNISVGDVIDHVTKLKAPPRGKTKFADTLEAELLETGAVAYGDPVLKLVKAKQQPAIEVASGVTQ